MLKIQTRDFISVKDIATQSENEDALYDFVNDVLDVIENTQVAGDDIGPQIQVISAAEFLDHYDDAVTEGHISPTHAKELSSIIEELRTEVNSRGENGTPLLIDVTTLY